MVDWLRELFESVFPLFEKLSILRALLGILLVFFIPGFAWALVFFRHINVISRIFLSIGLSIAIVTLSLLFLNKLLGISITGFSAILIIIVVTIIPVVLYYLNRLIGRGEGSG